MLAVRSVARTFLAECTHEECAFYSFVSQMWYVRNASQVLQSFMTAVLVTTIPKLWQALHVKTAHKLVHVCVGSFSVCGEYPAHSFRLLKGCVV